MDSIDFAWLVAEKSHDGQKYGNEPYINHVHNVQLAVSSLPFPKGQIKKLRTVAILHDVFEDSKLFTLKDMTSCYSKEIVDALDAITKREGEDYHLDYLNRVKNNKLAKIVKVCDLNENLKNSVRDKKEKNIIKYEKALRLIKTGEEKHG